MIDSPRSNRRSAMTRALTLLPDSIEDRSFLPPLTGIERTVIAALAKGMHSKEIAMHVGRSKATVEGYVRVLFIKFNVRSRAQLVALAYEVGVL